MYFTGIIDDVYEDGYIKFKVEDSDKVFELPEEIFKNAEVDSRYKINITPLLKYDRIREQETYSNIS